MEMTRNSWSAVLVVVGFVALGCGISVAGAGCDGVLDIPSDESVAGPPDGGGCFPLMGSLPAWANVASGTVTGDGVSATLCKIPVYLTSSSSPNGPLRANEPVLFFGLDSNQSVGVEIDAGRARGFAEAQLGLPAPMPGTYTSGDGTCGFVMFQYDGTPAPDASCTGTPPACSPNCVTHESSPDSGYCGPQYPQDHYEATAGSVCLDLTPVTPDGAWTLDLFTVDPANVDAGAGVTAYLVHGRLAAVLSDGAGGLVNLSLAF
jgi:hypothetical protein